MKDYKLVKVGIENVMKCKAFHWTGSGWGLVSLKGKNGAGKSSVLKGLTAALCGRRAVPEEILRDGEHSWRAEVVLQTLDGTETLTVIAGGKKSGTPGLKVLDGEGNQIAAPQGVLDAIVSGEQLDPLKLLHAKPAEQQKMLLKAMGCGFDLDNWMVERRRVYDQRTELNRQVKTAETQAAGIMSKAEATGKAKATVSDSAEITAKIQEAMKHNGEIDVLVANITAKREQHTQATKRVKELQTELKKAEARAETLREEVNSLADQLNVSEHICTDDIQAELAAVQQAGAERERAKSALARWADVDRLGKLADECTATLATLDRTRDEALAGVKLPVEGLEFTEDGLRYNGHALEQASSGEGLTVAVALAAGLKPHLRLVCIDEGSVLDADHWIQLGRIAEDRELNIIILAVDHGQPGILIQDGEVVQE